MQKGLVEVYDVTRLENDFTSEEYRMNQFNGTWFEKTVWRAL